MKITIMVGNGFDIALGIKSSYTDFYEWFCKQPSSSEAIEKMKASIAKEKTWADLELGLGQYTSNFSLENIDKFIACYENIQREIITYLNMQLVQLKNWKHTQDEIVAFSHSIWNFYDEISDQEKNKVRDVANSPINENKEYTFVSFNYTDTLEKILEYISNVNLSTWKYGEKIYAHRINKNVIHVHGTTNEFPIIGVNDETQIANKDLLKAPQFKEFVIKSETVNELGMLWHQQAEDQIEMSRFICVLGMSIGSSDTKWWQNLIQWLSQKSDRHLIIYWYEKDPPNGVSFIKQIQCVNNVKEKFLSYSKLSDENKQSLKRRIHVVINSKKFLYLPPKHVEAGTANELTSVLL